MPAAATTTEAGAIAPGRADVVRALVERDYPMLHRRVVALLTKAGGGLRPGERLGQATEVLQEAVRRALDAAVRFDPARDGTAWLMGIAVNVIREQQKVRISRPFPGSDLGEDNWRAVLEQLRAAETDPAARLDAERLLAALDESKRRLLELHFWQGLDGEELARAADAPSAGAARVRLFRALRALRERFGAVNGEATT